MRRTNTNVLHCTRPQHMVSRICLSFFLLLLSIDFEMLCLSLNSGSRRMVDFLIEHGVDVNALDNSQATALHLSARRGLHTKCATCCAIWLITFYKMNSAFNQRHLWNRLLSKWIQRMWWHKRHEHCFYTFVTC